MIQTENVSRIRDVHTQLHFTLNIQHRDKLTSGTLNRLSSLETAMDRLDPESPMTRGMLGDEHAPVLFLFSGWETTDKAVLVDRATVQHVS